MSDSFVVAVTGHRDVHPGDQPLIVAAMRQFTMPPGLERDPEARANMTPPALIRFGGAFGADTLALVAAASRGPRAPTKLAVYWPFGVGDRPRDWRERRWPLAHEIVLLGVPSLRLRKSPYLFRNDALLVGCAGFNAAIVSGGGPIPRDHPLHGRRADLLLAFWDGGREGGTAYTVRTARELGIPVEHVRVRRS